MQNFQTSDHFESLGGCQGFYFSPVNRIAAIPEAFASRIESPISMIEPFVMLQGYASPGSLSFSESAKLTPSGIIYSVSIKGFYPGASAEMISLFGEMMANRFVVLVADAHGTTRLAGSLQEPLSFSFQFSSKSVPAERAGYEFIFSGELTSVCPIYQP